MNHGSDGIEAGCSFYSAQHKAVLALAEYLDLDYEVIDRERFMEYWKEHGYSMDKYCDTTYLKVKRNKT